MHAKHYVHLLCQYDSRSVYSAGYEESQHFLNYMDSICKFESNISCKE